MNCTTRLVIVFTLFAFPLVSKGNSVKDSLLQLAHSSKNDTVRINALIIAGEAIYPGSLDTCLAYWQKAITWCDKALKKHKGKTQLKLSILKASALSNIGIVYSHKGQSELSLEYSFKALKIREAIENKHGIAESHNNIASVYIDLGDTVSALAFLKKSRVFYAAIHDLGGVAYTCLNMAKIYVAKKKDDQAMELLLEARAILEKLPHLKSALAISIHVMGIIEQRKGEINAAKKHYQLALGIRKSLNDNSGISQSYAVLSRFYAEMNKPDSAFYCAKQSYTYAEKTRMPESISNAAFVLSGELKKRKDFENSLHYYSLYIRMRDSINNDKTQKALLRNQFKYQYDNKLATDSIQKAEADRVKNAKQEARLENERFQRYVLYGGLAFVMIFLGFLYSRFRIIRQQKATIEEQKHIVDVKNKEMLDSMHYAEQIQRALLPSASILSDTFNDHFILFKPKDIVSGDFYWSAKRVVSRESSVMSGARVGEGHAQKNSDSFDLYLAVCDSTGHGVPGAFMSLLNISFLNEAVVEKQIAQPNEVLNYVRQRLIENVSREGAQDGMDGTLLHYNRQSMMLHFASAYNKPVLIRNGHLTELQADKMPIGKGHYKESFTHHSLKLEKNDLLYFFSDGYADQFGGEKGKKFKNSNLHKLLQSISGQPMNQQCELLNQHFENWRGRFEQLDDVCVIGVKI